MSRVNYQGRRRVDNDTLAYSIKSSKFENASHDEPFATRLVNELVQSWQRHCNVENRRIRELEIKPLKKNNTTTNQLEFWSSTVLMRCIRSPPPKTCNFRTCNVMYEHHTTCVPYLICLWFSSINMLTTYIVVPKVTFFGQCAKWRESSWTNSLMRLRSWFWVGNGVGIKTEPEMLPRSNL